MGRLTAEKGVRDLIALAQLQPDLTVSIAGAGPLQPEVEQAATRVPNLVYLGELGRKAVADRIGSSSVVLVPSRWDEPASLAALESMSFGTPVVSYGRGGVAEYVRASEAGLVSERDDPQALAEACRRLATDGSLWQACSSAGLRATSQEHSRTKYLDRLEGVYADAAK